MNEIYGKTVQSMLKFRTIDLEKYGDLCIAHRRDSYARSFPDGADRFDRENGLDGSGYLGWLQERIDEYPEGCVHGWDGDTIVGQLEMRIRPDGSGYVNLYYLTPEYRGSGAGDELQAYAEAEFRRSGVTVARLSVSPTNTRAVRYYAKHSWKDLGPRPGHPEVHLFELPLGS